MAAKGRLGPSVISELKGQGLRLIRHVFWNLTEDKSWVNIALGALGSALAAGTLPEIIKLLPGGNAALFVAFAVGIILLLATWLAFQSRYGIGIAVFLMPDSGADWSDDAVLAAALERRRDHVSFFYVNIDELSPGVQGVERYELTRRVIEARLREEAFLRKARKMSLYLTCNLSAAFGLG